jgi:tetrahydromethanopterin S-methyltransferase subunit G
MSVNQDEIEQAIKNGNCDVIRRFGRVPRDADHIDGIVTRLESIKEKLMMFDGWSRKDTQALNEAIRRLR